MTLGRRLFSHLTAAHGRWAPRVGHPLRYLTTSSEPSSNPLEEIWPARTQPTWQYDALQNHEICELKHTGSNKGWGLFAKCDVSVGTAVLNERPLLMLATDFNRCKTCLKPVGKTKREGRVKCNNCNYVFCSRKCKVDSAYHSPLECGAYTYTSHDNMAFPKLAIQAVSKLVANNEFVRALTGIRYASVDQKMIPHEWGDWLRDGGTHVFRAMRRHKGQLGKEAKELGLEGFLHSLAGHPPSSPISSSDQSFLRANSLFCYIVTMLHINAFKLTGPGATLDDQEKIATAVFAVASMFNHSCDANVEVMPVHGGQEENWVTFQATRDIQKGEELSLTYCDPTMPHEDRRAFLHFHYGFECECPKCVQEAKNTKATQRQSDSAKHPPQ